MVGPQRFVLDGEGSLVQRLGFPVAALVPVEQRQVVEAFGSVRVLRPRRLFANGEGALAQRRGFRVARAAIKVVTTLVEETGCCRRIQPEVFQR